MDLNCLFHRHQVSLMRADAAIDDETRDSFDRQAMGYAERIGCLQRDLGAGMIMGRSV